MNLGKIRAAALAGEAAAELAARRESKQTIRTLAGTIAVLATCNGDHAAAGLMLAAYLQLGNTAAVLRDQAGTRPRKRRRRRTKATATGPVRSALTGAAMMAVTMRPTVSGDKHIAARAMRADPVHAGADVAVLVCEGQKLITARRKRLQRARGEHVMPQKRRPLINARRARALRRCFEGAGAVTVAAAGARLNMTPEEAHAAAQVALLYLTVAGAESMAREAGFALQAKLYKAAADLLADIHFMPEYLAGLRARVIGPRAAKEKVLTKDLV
ncbi:MAG: hypothetical protein GC131_02760 [Alphaproteobacteria bacterium]|nr:hypothetical protein [Alphaproteobacteria bacterium]